MVAFKSYIAFVTGWQNDRLLSLLFVPPILVGVWTLLPAIKIPTWLSRLSFPVYLLHALVMYVGGLFFDWHAETILGWWKKYIFAIVGSVITAVFLKRFFPRFSALAFGGRL